MERVIRDEPPIFSAQKSIHAHVPSERVCYLAAIHGDNAGVGGERKGVNLLVRSRELEREVQKGGLGGLSKQPHASYQYRVERRWKRQGPLMT